VALASYLSQREPALLTQQARGFIEAALAMAAYVSFCEHCVNRGRAETKLFKGFDQRSAGPLWKLLRESLEQLGDKSDISAPYRKLLAPELRRTIDKAVNFVAQEKHDKAEGVPPEMTEAIQALANVSQQVFSRSVFGFFEGVKRERFSNERSYKGRFRHAHGQPPFITVSAYSGEEDFPELEAFLVDTEKSTALPLQPLFFWDNCAQHADANPGHCYLYDNEPVKGKFSFKAAGHTCTREVSGTTYSFLADLLLKYQECDQKRELVTVSLKEITEE
jgi:hypothetical protein